MPFLTNGKIRYFQFHELGETLIQAIFTRSGGTSPSPWATLNMGGTVGDDPSRVSENRLRALKVLDRRMDSVYDVWQVHGTDVVVADAPLPKGSPHLKADILLTDVPGVTLMMRFADCVPIFLFDPVHRVIGMVHAGWMGTVNGAARIAVEAMQDRFGSEPVNILAAIGPSIGPDHYEIGDDVIRCVLSAFGKDTMTLIKQPGGSTHFNMWLANQINLEQVGVNRIQLAGICTACHTEDWFSHRAEKGRTGRFGAILALGN